MKHGEGRAIAEGLYINDQMTFNEIAAHIGRAEKTVRLWAGEGNWKEKREKFLKTRQSVHEKLYVVVDKIADKIIEDCEQGGQLDPGRLYAMSRLVDKLEKLYKYEGIKKQAEKDAEGKKDGATQEAIAKKVEEILGL